jgi:hypothetical protein
VPQDARSFEVFAETSEALREHMDAQLLTYLQRHVRVSLWDGESFTPKRRYEGRVTAKHDKPIIDRMKMDLRGATHALVELTETDSGVTITDCEENTLAQTNYALAAMIRLSGKPHATLMMSVVTTAKATCGYAQAVLEDGAVTFPRGWATPDERFTNQDARPRSSLGDFVAGEIQRQGGHMKAVNFVAPVWDPYADRTTCRNDQD